MEKTYIESWFEEIENVYLMFGANTALESIKKEEENIPEVIKQLAVASIHFRWGDHLKALEITTSIKNQLTEIELKHRHLWYWVHGASLRILGKEEAKIILEEGTKLYPESVNLWNEWYTLLDTWGIESWESTYPKAVEQFGEQHPIMLTYAYKLFKDEENDKAIKLSERILELDPNNTGAMEIIGHIAFEREEDEKAYKYLSRSAELWPYKVLTLETLVTIALVLRNYGDAIDVCTYALNYHPHHEFFRSTRTAIQKKLEGNKP